MHPPAQHPFPAIRLLNLSRYLNSSTSARTYEEKKNDKRVVKIEQLYHPNRQNLTEARVDMTSMVPNLFAKTLTISSFNNSHSPMTAEQNHFENSYVSMSIPLSTSPELREKLNFLSTGTVRIGRLFELMDSMAGMVSYKHCAGGVSYHKDNKDRPMFCVTGSVESCHLFDRLKVDEDFLVEGYLNSVGKTSMEVDINIIQGGKLIITSLFTMIARDAKNMLKGYVVPQLSFDAMGELEHGKALLRLEMAKANLVRRKAEMENSYDKKAPNQKELEEIHTLFLRRKNEITDSSVPISKTVIMNSNIMQTELRNVHSKIFGGHLMREMLELGWVVACKYTGQLVAIEDLTNIYFKKPVEIGTRLTLKAQVTYVEKDRVVITV